MTDELKTRLFALAEKYERADFVNEDPSQFLRWYKDSADVEAGSFIAAMLAFGNRKQFIPKIREIFFQADKFGRMAQWLRNGAYECSFCSSDGDDEKKFYRFYSYKDMKALFGVLGKVIEERGSLGEYLREKFEAEIAGLLQTCPDAADSGKNVKSACLLKVFAETFADCKIVPKGKNSANKRVHMFLRWMVRKNSPVDLGLWNWYSPADLIIPLDTHVIQESVKMGLVKNSSSGKNISGNLKTVLEITAKLKEIWPEDPCRGDFALFGLGVDEDGRNDEQ